MPTAPLLATVLVSSQAPAAIVHESPACVVHGDYPRVQAHIDPPADVRSAKVYFRSDKYPKFYYVEMDLQEGALLGVLPRPSAETEQIVYYVEAVDVSFNSTLGGEQVLSVRSECPSPEAQEERETLPPSIKVGAVEAGSPAIPPGFEAAGIVGTIATTGLLTGLGGGPGVGTAVVAGVSAAAAAGGAIAASSGGESQESAGPDGPPAPRAPRSPGSTSSIPTTTSSAVTTSAPPSTTTSASATTTTTTAPPVPASTVSACFSAGFPGNSCNLKLDAACSSGTIISWEWVIDPGSSFGGPSTASGPTAQRNFPGCAGETVTVTLEVKSSLGARDTETQTIRLPAFRSEALRDLAVSCSVTSLLTSEDLLGTVIFDRSRLESIRGGTPVLHPFRAQPGEHELEAFLTAPGAEALWIFDFSPCEALATGSLKAGEGLVFASEGRRIAFRLGGAPGDRVTLRFRLSH